jgi:hypothetical protein
VQSFVSSKSFDKLHGIHTKEVDEMASCDEQILRDRDRDRDNKELVKRVREEEGKQRMRANLWSSCATPLSTAKFARNVM